MQTKTKRLVDLRIGDVFKFTEKDRKWKQVFEIKYDMVRYMRPNLLSNINESMFIDKCQEAEIIDLIDLVERVITKE